MAFPASQNGFLILIPPHKNKLVAPLLATGLIILWVLDVMQPGYTFFRDKAYSIAQVILNLLSPNAASQGLGL